MRKATAVLLTALLLTAAVPAALAGNGMTSYELNGLSMQIDLPDDWLVVTRYNNPGSETLEAMNFNAQNYKAFLEDNDIYLQAVDAGRQIMFTVTAPPDVPLVDLDIYQLSDLDVQALEDLRENYIDAFGNSGITFKDFYSANGITYYILDAKTGGGSIAQQYNTVVNGHMIVLTIGTTGGSKAPIEDIMRRIAVGAKIDNNVSIAQQERNMAEKTELPDEPVPAGFSETEPGKAQGMAAEDQDLAPPQENAGQQGAPVGTIVIIAAAVLALGGLAIVLIRRNRHKTKA